MSGFPQQLRRHRQQTGASQLAFSLAAGVSQRHLSALEVGRAKPSREMVTRLSEVLGLSLAESNDMLLAAGFAPQYGRRSLTDRAMAAGSRALDLMLRLAEPFPAFVIDADANIVRWNGAATPLVELARPGGEPLNLLWATLHPRAWRPLISNLGEIAPCLLRRYLSDRVLGEREPPDLWRRMLELPSVEAWLQEAHVPVADEVLMSIDVRIGVESVRWLSTLMALVAPQDVTLQEYKVECMLPEDTASERAWLRLREQWAGAVADVSAAADGATLST